MAENFGILMKVSEANYDFKQSLLLVDIIINWQMVESEKIV